MRPRWPRSMRAEVKASESTASLRRTVARAGVRPGGGAGSRTESSMSGMAASRPRRHQVRRKYASRAAPPAPTRRPLTRSSVVMVAWAGLPPGTTTASMRRMASRRAPSRSPTLARGTIASSTIDLASPSERYRSRKPAPVTSVAWPCRPPLSTLTSMSNRTTRPSLTPVRPTPHVSMIVRPSASASCGVTDPCPVGHDTIAISAPVRSLIAATIAWACAIVDGPEHAGDVVDVAPGLRRRQVAGRGAGRSGQGDEQPGRGQGESGPDRARSTDHAADDTGCGPGRAGRIGWVEAAHARRRRTMVSHVADRSAVPSRTQGGVGLAA